MFRRILYIAILSLSVTALACSDDSSGNNDNNTSGVTDAADDTATDTPTDTSGSTDTGDESDTTTSTDTGDDTSEDDTGSGEDTGSGDDTGSGGDAGGTCDERGGSTCFSNFDCVDGRICKNIGTDDEPDPCCILGERGTKSAGETCNPDTGEEECASAICIEGDSQALCSTRCDGVEDCPDGMKDCKSIAFSGTPDKFCFPEN